MRKISSIELNVYSPAVFAAEPGTGGGGGAVVDVVGVVARAGERAPVAGEETPPVP